MSTAPTKPLNWPLMANNITRDDLDALIEFLKQDDPILTQSTNVRAFEREWSEWLGVKHSVFINSGSSANQLTMTAIAEHYGKGDVIVPTLTWVSDIASVVQAGHNPVFVDINKQTLGMDDAQIIAKLTPNTKAVFLTHVLGYNALTDRLINELDDRGIPLIEDVCESHGATFHGQKVGSFGLVSNFSFYYAHHLSTIEGGMVCTNDDDLYETFRMLRSHGMVREASTEEVKDKYKTDYPDLNPEFIFAFPAYNVRSTELNAVIGRNQLPRLDANNGLRTRNLKLFLDNLDSDHYYTDFAVDGSSNYALTLVLKNADDTLCDAVMSSLKEHKVEYRRGLSGGGNQVRQPWVRKIVGDDAWQQYPNVDHVHKYGFYIGNYPTLETSNISALCALLNDIPRQLALKKSA